MLDKIKNLELNLSGSNSGNYYYGSDRGSRQERKGKDNYVKSEALKYLDELGWLIRAINFLTDKKLDISFAASEIEFRTRVNFNENILEEIRYALGYTIKDSAVPGKIIMELLVNTFPNTGYTEPVKLQALKLLFNRFTVYDFSGKISTAENEILDTIFNDIYFNIHSEINSITCQLVEFLFKLTNLKINIPPSNSDPYIKVYTIQTSGNL